MIKFLFKLILKILLFIIAVGIIVSIPVVVKGYNMYTDALEQVPLEDKVSEIQSKSDYISLTDLPSEFTYALLESEDSRFYEHSGVDIVSIGRAIWIDIKTMSFAEGGSTITQQLAKNMYFEFDKKLSRKVADALMAREIEKHYDKNEILELYINSIYFGEGCYGISAASRYYYGVAPSDLTQEQQAALIKTIKAPSVYNPAVSG
jgi:monofunctional glycosyltransferase